MSQVLTDYIKDMMGPGLAPAVSAPAATEVVPSPRIPVTVTTEADAEDTGTAAAQGMRLVAFELDGQSYALPIDEVREVLPRPSLTPVPGASRHCPGVLNLRGEIVTVLDLCSVIGLAPSQGQNLVVLNDSLALCVSAIGGILDAGSTGVEAPPNVGAAQPFVRGIVRHAGQFIQLLDVERLDGALEGAGSDVQPTPAAGTRLA